MIAIVAVERGWGIGLDGGLLLRNPLDMRRFKERTMGHPVILGRKTLESFPGGKPLPGRDNLVLSRTLEAAPPGPGSFGTWTACWPPRRRTRRPSRSAWRSRPGP